MDRFSQGHFSSYGKAPPGLLQDERPEDCIPDCPENKDAREFLAKAPTKGLWMPLGKQVKVMKCWRCKAYGHRTGDRECPLFTHGNAVIEHFRVTHEDPMHDYIVQNRLKKKEARIKQLQALLDLSSSDSDDSYSRKSHHPHRRKRLKCRDTDKRQRTPKRTSKHKKDNHSKEKQKLKKKRKSSNRKDR
ncbi:retinitis pigmentosa 9 protein-like isoform X3 [Ptychodera flava]|uniref:retinitis pigmentosa 9 protein-like isoform X3 n=1 Tax=Ptychodera flava TaxID=63121 RepID=UPI00396A06AD